MIEFDQVSGFHICISHLQHGTQVITKWRNHFDMVIQSFWLRKRKEISDTWTNISFSENKKLHTSSAAWNSDRLMRRSCRIRFSCITRSITCNQGGKSWYTSKINASSKLFSDPNFLCITSIRISRTSEYYLPQDWTRKISSNQTAQYFYYMTTYSKMKRS